MTDSPANERRKFTRIPFEASVTLSNPGGHWTGKLLDISLNGLLISKPQNWNIAKQDEKYLVEVHPADEVFTIRMEVHIAHSEESHVGLQCNYIDIDSASHLRRLVELNIGDEAILTRELSALLHSAA
ncbi:MAG: PilZ domain-containing protein [Gammaproteobacteria bacterium]|nr:PilZ domain-containing protein [Gammaproteobacteria bacterium]